MSKLWAVNIKGRKKEWEFTAYASEHDALAWKLDGLDVEEIVYTVPECLIGHGWAIQLWCTLQDVGLIPK